ncbi:MAG TPA: hypothetical protein VIC24_02835 [Gemmatimonadaceae bacterium]
MNGTEPDPLRSAVDAAASFFRAIDARQWESAAQCVDPDAAERFREAALRVLIGWATIRSMRSRVSDGPMGIALSRTLDPALLDRFAATPLRGVAGVSTLGDLAGLTPTQFVARSLEHREAEWTDRDAPADGPTRDVLGATSEGESYVQVLYRPNDPEVEYADPLPVLVLRMRHRDGHWLVDLEHTDHALVSPMLDDDDDEMPTQQA